MIRKKKFCIFMALTPFMSNAQQVKDVPIDVYANKVYQHYLSLKEPMNNLEKWQKDMWRFSAVSCIHEAKIPMPEIFNKPKLYTSGTYSSPKDRYETCKNLSSGPELTCFNLKPGLEPFGMPLSGMPRDYVYIEKGKSIKNDSKVMVSGYCYLSKDSKDKDKQFFAGSGTFFWNQPLHSMSINTFNGAQSVVGGYGHVVVEGLPEMFPFLVIQK